MCWIELTFKKAENKVLVNLDNVRYIGNATDKDIGNSELIFGETEGEYQYLIVNETMEEIAEIINKRQ